MPYISAHPRVFDLAPLRGSFTAVQVIWLCKSVDTADVFIDEDSGTARVLSPELLLCLLQASTCVVWPRATNRHRHYFQQHDVVYPHVTTLHTRLPRAAIGHGHQHREQPEARLAAGVYSSGQCVFACACGSYLCIAVCTHACLVGCGRRCPTVGLSGCSCVCFTRPNTRYIASSAGRHRWRE